MDGQGGLPRFGRLVVRRRSALMVAWALVAAVFIPQASRLPDRLEASARIDDSESAAVEALMRGPLESDFARYAVLVVRGLPPVVTEAGREALADIVGALETAPGVAGVFSYLTVPDPQFRGEGGEGTVLVVGLPGDIEPAELVPRLRARTDDLARELRTTLPEVTLRWTGEAALNVDLRSTSLRDVQRAEGRALPVTAILLLFAFGAVVAASLPVAAGAVAIAVTLGVAAAAARLLSLTLLLQSVVTMLGLGLGIDYALLMVSRFRDALAEQRDPEAAAEEAACHAGHTILLSAATVALGFIVLLIVPLNEVRSVATGGLLVVLVSALLATTLVPGILAMLGSRVDWGRLTPRSSRTASLALWRRWGRRVTGRPWVSLLAGGLPLVLLAAQAERLRIGMPEGEWLPSSMESARALDDLEAMGRVSLIQSIRVVLELPDGVSIWQPPPWESVRRYGEALVADTRVARVRSLVTAVEASGWSRAALVALPRDVTGRSARGMVSEDGRVILLEVLPGETVTAGQAVELARAIRSTGATELGIPGARVLVGGLPAFNADYLDAVAGRFPLVVALILTGTMLALFIGFRSVLIPLKAVALNLLSVAAAFGAVTLVFQEGHGAGLIGVSEPLDAVFSSLPVIVFCIVFGLSMDYEVFLLTRVREVRRSGASNREAIVEGLGRTGKVITNAAVIMLAVFAAFTLGEVLIMKMLGFALAVAVLLDATVVRMVVGPALLQLAGRWNWWPGALGAPLRPPAGS